jgi:response regulator of citrate/malate metabolism
MEKIKSLIVEDDPNWLKLFNELIANNHKLFDFSMATTMAEAMKKLKEAKVELVVLDLLLPDSQAADTINSVRKIAPFVPIVVVTTFSDNSLINKALEYGIEEYIIKDEYDEKVFLDAARRAIKNSESRQQAFESMQALKVDLQSILKRLEKYEEQSHPVL